MRTFRIISMAVLISAIGTAATSWAQVEKCWRIVDGKGAGFILSGTGNCGFGPCIDNPELGAEGFIAEGHFDDCECTEFAGHYHGTLFGIPDPDPNGCGWGCVIRAPCNLNEAQLNFIDAIDAFDDFAPGLAAKVRMVLEDSTNAINDDCFSVLAGNANAIGEEVLGARANQQITDEQMDNLLEAFANWINQAFDVMNGPEPTNNLPANTNDPCCKVSLVLRKGSAAQTKFFDAKRKINADLGQVLVLDVDACPKDGAISWEYDFMGAPPKGDVPSGTGVSFSPKRFCVVAERKTSVKVTVTLKCPDGKEAKDSVTISYQ